MVRRLLHRTVDVACDLALEVYDTTLDVRDHLSRRAAERAAVPGWDDVTVVG